jgi:hypothetical protein
MEMASQGSDRKANLLNSLIMGGYKDTTYSYIAGCGKNIEQISGEKPGPAAAPYRRSKGL